MVDVSLPDRKRWHGEAFRNIATCDPSQDLYDDLVDPEEYEALFEIESLTQGIDQNQIYRNRCFQYGDIDRSTVCFDDFFKWSRFSNGAFGVWYGALDEQTSIRETSYKRPEIDFVDFSNANGPIIQCRRLFRADLATESSVDLTSISEIYTSLTSDDYGFCQELGAHAVREGIDMFLTPSARQRSGICTPVFSRLAIKQDVSLRTYLVIYRDQNQPPKYAIVSDDI